MSFVFISGCAATSSEPSASPTTPSESASPSFSPAFPRSERVPDSCENTKFLEIVQTSFKVSDAKVISVPYQPNEGTPLFKVLNEGGIICDFGNQETSQGISVGWFEDDGTVFDEFSNVWKDMGYKKADIPGINETRGQFLFREGTSEGQPGIWSVNFVVDGMWIQIFTNLAEDLESGEPLIAEAISAFSAN